MYYYDHPGITEYLLFIISPILLDQINLCKVQVITASKDKCMTRTKLTQGEKGRTNRDVNEGSEKGCLSIEARQNKPHTGA